MPGETMNESVYDPQSIVKRLDAELPCWSHEAGHLTREYRVEAWRGAMLLANAIGHLAECAWHHPELIINWGSVRVRLRTHSANGITDKDFELALRLEQCLLWRPESSGALSGPPDDAGYRYLATE